MQSKGRKNAPPNQQKQFAGNNPPGSKQVTQIQQSGFSGPIPEPEMLSKYAATDETTPNRIVVMAEKDQDHIIDINTQNFELNKMMLNHQVVSEKRGQWFALVICLVTLTGGIYLISTGSLTVSITGAVITLSTLAGLAYTFTTGRRRNPPDNK